MFNLLNLFFLVIVNFDVVHLFSSASAHVKNLNAGRNTNFSQSLHKRKVVLFSWLLTCFP